MHAWVIRFRGFSCAVAFVALLTTMAGPLPAEPLPSTEELTWDGDLAAKLVDQADAFLLRELDASIERRAAFWQRDASNLRAYESSIHANRQRLAYQLGARDARPTSPRVELLVSPSNVKRNLLQPAQIETRIGHGEGYDVLAVQFRAFEEVECVALLLQPTTRVPVADVIAVPHCDTLPEQLAGLVEGVDVASQFARRLAESGCRVVVPLRINCQRGQFDWGARPAPSITNREMLYRSAFEVGRGLVAYEVEMLHAITDYLQASSTQGRPVGIFGWGEGGLLALYAGALDTRIRSVGVSGYFDSRQQLWQEPLDRNICGLLREFGDAELASLIAPRSLVVEAAAGPVESHSGEGGGAPATLTSPPLPRVQAEIARARTLIGLGDDVAPTLVISGDEGQGPYGTDPALQAFLQRLHPEARLSDSDAQPQLLDEQFSFAPAVREQMRNYDRHTQLVLLRSPNVRRDYMQQLDTSSAEAYQQTSAAYRERFYDEVIGRYDYPLQAPRPRSRQVYETANWKGYEVVLDVFDSIYAYGILIVPKSIQAGEQRPVVVCQHGREGRPQDTVGLQGAHYYAGFAGALADRGFITFAPQNLYIGGDRFRTLQRKSHPLGKTLYSIIVPQHQHIVNWLKTRPIVDPQRIAS